MLVSYSHIPYCQCHYTFALADSTDLIGLSYSANELEFVKWMNDNPFEASPSSSSSSVKPSASASMTSSPSRQRQTLAELTESLLAFDLDDEINVDPAVRAEQARLLEMVLLFSYFILLLYVWFRFSFCVDRFENVVRFGPRYWHSDTGTSSKLYLFIRLETIGDHTGDSYCTRK